MPAVPNNPTASTPQSPPSACAEIAPPGSSTWSFSSNHSTEKVTNAPATAPTTTASGGLMNAQTALLATRPPTHPLTLSEASGFLTLTFVTIAAVSPAETAQSIRSEEHTSELQSPVHLVSRLLLEKKNTQNPLST